MKIVYRLLRFTMIPMNNDLILQAKNDKILFKIKKKKNNEPTSLSVKHCQDWRLYFKSEDFHVCLDVIHNRGQSGWWFYFEYFNLFSEFCCWFFMLVVSLSLSVLFCKARNGYIISSSEEIKKLFFCFFFGHQLIFGYPIIIISRGKHSPLRCCNQRISKTEILMIRINY